jgi:hypothetical protein
LIVTRRIVGLRNEESDAILGFLLAHIARGIDYQARVRWQPKTVVVWDVSFISVLLYVQQALTIYRTVLRHTRQLLIGSLVRKIRIEI